MVKINWDVALDIHNKKIGLGIIVRDDNGSFLVAYSKQQSIEVTPVIVETLEPLNVVIFCKEQGFMRAIFEGDSL